MIYGYARVSTQAQAREGNSLEAQEKALRNAGASLVFSDTYTGTKNDRPQLDRLLETISEEDILVVCKLDRMARNLKQGIELIDALNMRGVKVNVLNMGLIDNTPTGRLIRNIMLALAEWERDMIVERTREGKEIARQNPNYRDGRPRKYKREQREHALELLEEYSYKQVEKLTGISTATLTRMKREAKKAG